MGDAHHLSQQIATMVQRASALALRLPRDSDQTPLLREAVFELCGALEELNVLDDELREQNALLLAKTAELEHERRRYRELFVLAPMGYLTTRRDGVITEANAAAAELLGLSDSVLVGKAIGVFVVRTEFARMGVLLDRLDADASDMVEDVLVLHTFDRSRQFRCCVRVGHEGGPHGEPVGYRWVIQDATTRERAAQADRLLRESQSKDELLAMLGHELRNPLAPIRAAVDLWRHHGDRLTPDQSRWSIEVVARHAEHLAHVVDDLLDASRVALGKVRLRRRTFDLREIIDDARDAIRQSAELHALALELPRHPVLVDGDPNRLRQVVLDLLDNAIKYTPRGGAIGVSLHREVGAAVIHVHDEGVGIAPEMLEAMFEPFVQGERTLNRSQGGVGLGLTLVRQLVELHGGTVTAHSAGPGCGSDFEVRLPLVETVGDEPARTGIGGLVRDTPVRVLVVDDNEDAAEMLGMLLRASGHVVELAFDAVRARAVAERFTPELVLLDLGLPDIDGLQLGRELVARFPHALIAALTGYGDGQIRQQTRAIGLHHHLLKPIDIEDLGRLLDDAAERGAQS